MLRAGGIAALAVCLLLSASATAQDTTFPSYRAAKDQYEPEPTPTPTPTPTAAPTATPTPAATAPAGGGTKQNPPGQEASRPGSGGNKGGNGAKRGRDDGAGVKGADRGHREQGAALPLTASQGGSLPFTGFDLMTLGLLGLLAIAGGFALRALTRARQGSRGSDGLSSRARS